jgi:surface antigen
MLRERCHDAKKIKCTMEMTFVDHMAFVASRVKSGSSRMKLRPLRSIAVFLIVAATLSACNTIHGAAGMVGLSPIKANASTTYIAALEGGIVSRTGVKISDSDKQRALEAEYRALEAAPGGQPVVWSGRGVSGQVVAAAPYQVGSQNCRQYTHTLTIDTKQAVARGSACRNDDGTWTPLG